MKTNSTNFNLIVGLFFLLIIGGCYKCIQDGDRYEKQKAYEKAHSTSVTTDEVYVIAEECLKGILKAPSTADIPPSGTVQDLGNNTYKVISYVDAQNSYGAKLRNNWYCELKYKGGAWDDLNNWEIVDIRLLE